jgi:hypothetical protein
MDEVVKKPMEQVLSEIEMLLSQHKTLNSLKEQIEDAIATNEDNIVYKRDVIANYYLGKYIKCQNEDGICYVFAEHVFLKEDRIEFCGDIIDDGYTSSKEKVLYYSITFYVQAIANFELISKEEFETEFKRIFNKEYKR